MYKIACISCHGITESSTDPPAVPPANLVVGAFGSDGRWVGVVEGALRDWLQVGRVMSIVEHNYVIIDGEGEGGDEIKVCS